MNQEKTGRFLKELRNEKGITQESLAKMIGVSGRTVSRWETGKNMPDISILVEIADFYEVDIRELIDGERKSEKMDEEVKEVALKVADYKDVEKGRLLVWIRRISLIGVVFLAMVLVLQTFQYEPGMVSSMCYVFCVIAFVAMTISALYTNGSLEKMENNNKLFKAFKIFIFGIAGVVLLFVLRMMVVFALLGWIEISPAENISGIQNYDKEYYMKKYANDLNTGLFIFPDDTEHMINPMFKSSMDTGLFDTDGYMILHTQYSKEEFAKEEKRLANVQCTICSNAQNVTQKVKYDKDSYKLPAYVASDGYDYVYEYALVNAKDNSITYVYLSYPKALELIRYKKYLKVNLWEYKIKNVLNKFSIYSHSFDGGNSWVEYSNEK